AGPDRVRGAAGHPGDHPPAAARGLPARGVPPRARDGRQGSGAEGPPRNPPASPRVLRGARRAAGAVSGPLERLLGLVRWERAGMRLGVERIEALLDELDRPEAMLRIVHIGGTNGKGSVAALTAAILRAAGLRTGLYT